MAKKLPDVIQKHYNLFQLKNVQYYANVDGSWRLAFDIDEKALIDLVDKRQTIIFQTCRRPCNATHAHGSPA